MTPSIRALRLLVIPLLSAVFVAAAPAPVGAKRATRKETVAAKKHFKAGQTHYKLGRFDDALAEYSKAYEIMPIAAFLFNIAQCHMELGNYERAQFFFQGFLRENPDAPNRQVVEVRIEEAKTELQREEEDKQNAEAAKLEEERRKAAEAERVAEEERRKAAEAERKAAEERKLTAALQVEAAEKVLAAEAEPEFYETWWFWTIVGVAVAGGATGAIVGATGGGETITVPPSGSLGTISGL